MEWDAGALSGGAEDAGEGGPRGGEEGPWAWDAAGTRQRLVAERARLELLPRTSAYVVHRMRVVARAMVLLDVATGAAAGGQQQGGGGGGGGGQQGLQGQPTQKAAADELADLLGALNF